MALIKRWVESMAMFPQRGQRDMTEHMDAMQKEIDFQILSVRDGKDVVVAGLIMPKHETRIKHVLVAFHGNAQSICSLAERVRLLTVMDKGTLLVLPEYPHYLCQQMYEQLWPKLGDEQQLAAFRRRYDYRVGHTTEMDLLLVAEQTCRWLFERYRPESTRYTLFGFSLGCGVAAKLSCDSRLFGTSRKTMLSLLLCSPFRSITQVGIGLRLPSWINMLDVEGPLLHQPRWYAPLRQRTICHAGRVLIIHPKDDPIISYVETVRLSYAIRYAWKYYGIEETHLTVTLPNETDGYGHTLDYLGDVIWLETIRQRLFV
jgi:predicted esterase